MSETSTSTVTSSKPEEKAGEEKVLPKVDQETMTRCGLTAAVIGFLCGGPLLSAMLGFLVAYASQKQDKAGDYARSLGKFGASVQAKAEALNEKHHILERYNKVAADAWEKAVQYDGNFNVLEKTRGALAYVWLLLAAYAQQHRLLERGVELAGKGYEYVAERIGRDRLAKKED